MFESIVGAVIGAVLGYLGGRRLERDGRRDTDKIAVDKFFSIVGSIYADVGDNLEKLQDFYRYQVVLSTQAPFPAPTMPGSLVAPIDVTLVQSALHESSHLLPKDVRTAGVGIVRSAEEINKKLVDIEPTFLSAPTNDSRIKAGELFTQYLVLVYLTSELSNKRERFVHRSITTDDVIDLVSKSYSLKISVSEIIEDEIKRIMAIPVA